jgi:uncharacterized Zn finger protein
VDKARQYLTAGRVRIMSASGRYVDALVIGSGAAPYAVSFSEGTGWSCTCQARVIDCAHVYAVRLVTGADVKVDDLIATHRAPAAGRSSKE